MIIRNAAIGYAESALELAAANVIRAATAIDRNELEVADVYIRSAETLMDNAQTVLMYGLGVELELSPEGGKGTFDHDTMVERLRATDDRLSDATERLVWAAKEAESK